MNSTERRKKNFQAKIDKDRDGIYLKITHNGYQWSSISLDHREMEIVREVLSQELKKVI